ncbi:hypothetical protein P7M10_22880 [Vibrio parahaemolyticus]|nr:hypothetical protein [Vibrio harveyi]MDG2748977.1 hypothetical protein [Vibrio parahaemolyticus]HDM8199154.1 hypothetical protein [Vibrio harveyi]
MELDNMQSYFDERTKEPLQLWFGKHFDIIEGKQVHLTNVPLLKNPKTGEVFYPDKTKQVISHFLSEAKRRNEGGIDLCPRELGSKRYPYSEELNFKYSSIDYEYIPGLYRPWNEGFLTPVYFKIGVLNKFSQNPEYEIDLLSSTYGTISFKDEWNIQFGLNKDKIVIMWLGDIDRLPEDEKYYLRSENIESVHCIHSEFYNAQIEVEWAEPSIENKVFELRNNFSSLTKKAFGESIYMLDGEVSEVISNLDKPVFWEDKHVSPVIESLNRIFVESLNSVGIKSILRGSNPELDLKNKKGLKLLSLYIEHNLKKQNPEQIMCPFFVLYDFRILVCHLRSNESRDELLARVNERLGLRKDQQSFEEIYDRLFVEMEKSYQEILSDG